MYVISELPGGTITAAVEAATLAAARARNLRILNAPRSRGGERVRRGDDVPRVLYVLSPDGTTGCACDCCERFRARIFGDSSDEGTGDPESGGGQRGIAQLVAEPADSLQRGIAQRAAQPSLQVGDLAYFGRFQKNKPGFYSAELVVKAGSQRLLVKVRSNCSSDYAVDPNSVFQAVVNCWQ